MIEPTRVASFDDEMYRDLHGLEKDCPIGLDDAFDICSAGTCQMCRKLREQRIADRHDITKSDMGFK